MGKMGLVGEKIPVILIPKNRTKERAAIRFLNSFMVCQKEFGVGQAVLRGVVVEDDRHAANAMYACLKGVLEYTKSGTALADVVQTVFHYNERNEDKEEIVGELMRYAYNKKGAQVVSKAAKAMQQREVVETVEKLSGKFPTWRTLIGVLVEVAVFAGAERCKEVALEIAKLSVDGKEAYQILDESLKIVEKTTGLVLNRNLVTYNRTDV